jgi:Family of unknown function (DUF6510)
MSADDNRDRASLLDGNAAAGLLSQLFAVEATTARVTCGGCGIAAEVGAVRVYGGSMGAIFRCAHCDTAIIRVAQTPAGLWFDMRGRLHVPA